MHVKYVGYFHKRLFAISKCTNGLKDKLNKHNIYTDYFKCYIHKKCISVFYLNSTFTSLTQNQEWPVMEMWNKIIFWGDGARIGVEAILRPHTVTLTTYFAFFSTWLDLFAVHGDHLLK